MGGVNHLGVFLQGGIGAPPYAPEGVLRYRGLSVEQLARASDVTRTAIYNYINGENRPTGAVLRRICEALNLSFDEGLKYCTPAPVGRPAIDADPPNYREPRRKRRNPPTTPLAQKILSLTQQHEPPMGIKDLAEALGISYEHARRLVRGEALPSRLLLQAIAAHFGVDIRELENLRHAERMQREFGEIPAALEWGEEIKELACSWEGLTARQKEIIRANIGVFLALNAAGSEKS